MRHLLLGQHDIRIAHGFAVDGQHGHDVALLARRQQLAQARLFGLAALRIRLAVRVQHLGGAAEQFFHPTAVHDFAAEFILILVVLVFVFVFVFVFVLVLVIFLARGPVRLLRLGRLRVDVVKAEHIGLARVLLKRAGFTGVAGRFHAVLLGVLFIETVIETGIELRIEILAEIVRPLGGLVGGQQFLDRPPHRPRQRLVVLALQALGHLPVNGGNALLAQLANPQHQLAAMPVRQRLATGEHDQSLA